MLAIRLKSDNVVATIQFGHLPRQLVLLDGEPPQDALESDEDGDAAQIVDQVLEEVVRRIDRVSYLGNGEDHSFVDGAENRSEPSGSMRCIDRA